MLKFWKTVKVESSPRVLLKTDSEVVDFANPFLLWDKTQVKVRFIAISADVITERNWFGQQRTRVEQQVDISVGTPDGKSSSCFDWKFFLAGLHYDLFKKVETK